MRIDAVFNVMLWLANAAVWVYNGSIPMALFSMLGVLGSVMLARLYAS